jgi:hypothetical protein
MESVAGTQMAAVAIGMVCRLGAAIDSVGLVGVAQKVFTRPQASTYQEQRVAKSLLTGVKSS